MLAAPNGLSYPRLGLAISKKAVSRAVARNRIKRIIRESFRRHQGDMAGWDIVVMAKMSAATTTRQALRAELEAYWNTLRRPAHA
jgi:ribonuclease P protein component